MDLFNSIDDYLKIPKIDVGDRMGHTDYDDFITENDFGEHVMIRFQDKYLRYALSFLYTVKWVAGHDHDFFDGKHLFGITIFQRYASLWDASNSLWDESNSLLIAYNSLWVACKTDNAYEILDFNHINYKKHFTKDNFKELMNGKEIDVIIPFINYESICKIKLYGTSKEKIADLYATMDQMGE